MEPNIADCRYLQAPERETMLTLNGTPPKPRMKTNILVRYDRCEAKSEVKVNGESAHDSERPKDYLKWKRNRMKTLLFDAPSACSKVSSWLKDCSQSQKCTTYERPQVPAVDTPRKPQGILVRQDFEKPHPSCDSNSSADSKRKQIKLDVPLSPESRKKTELCNYLKLMDLKSADRSNGAVLTNRRSTRVKNLMIMSEKRELERKLSVEARIREDCELSKKSFEELNIDPNAKIMDVLQTLSLRNNFHPSHVPPEILCRQSDFDESIGEFLKERRRKYNKSNKENRVKDKKTNMKAKQNTKMKIMKANKMKENRIKSNKMKVNRNKIKENRIKTSKIKEKRMKANKLKQNRVTKESKRRLIVQEGRMKLRKKKLKQRKLLETRSKLVKQHVDSRKSASARMLRSSSCKMLRSRMRVVGVPNLYKIARKYTRRQIVKPPEEIVGRVGERTARLNVKNGHKRIPSIQGDDEEEEADDEEEEEMEKDDEEEEEVENVNEEEEEVAKHNEEVEEVEKENEEDEEVEKDDEGIKDHEEVEKDDEEAEKDIEEMEKGKDGRVSEEEDLENQDNPVEGIPEKTPKVIVQIFEDWAQDDSPQSQEHVSQESDNEGYCVLHTAMNEHNYTKDPIYMEMNELKERIQRKKREMAESDLNASKSERLNKNSKLENLIDPSKSEKTIRIDVTKPEQPNDVSSPEKTNKTITSKLEKTIVASKTYVAKSDKVSKTDVGKSEKGSKTDADKSEKVNKTDAGKSEKLSKTDAGKLEKVNKTDAAKSEKVSKTDAGKSEKVNKTDVAISEKVSKTDIGKLVKVNKTDVAKSEKVSKTDVAKSEKVSKTDIGKLVKVNKTDLGKSEKVSKTDIGKLVKVSKTDVGKSDKISKSDANKPEKASKCDVVSKLEKVSKPEKFSKAYVTKKSKANKLLNAAKPDGTKQSETSKLCDASNTESDDPSNTDVAKLSDLCKVTLVESTNSESVIPSPIEPQDFRIPVCKDSVKSLHRNLMQNKRKANGEVEIWGNSPRGSKAEKKSHSISINDADGAILDAQYFDYNLVVTQDLMVSFWTQSALGFMLEAQNMWIPRGSIQRLTLDKGCTRKFSKENVICSENSFAYVELWTKEHKSDKRERPVADVFAVVYYWRSRTGSEKKFLQLENINGFADDVRYVVLKNSRCILVSWRCVKDDSAISVLHCYQLAADYQTIESIRELEEVEHVICSLHNIEDCDTLVMGCGDQKVTIWNLEFGYVVATIDVSDSLPEPRNLWTKCDRGFLFMLQQYPDGSFKLNAINGINHSWKRLQVYKPPQSGFDKLQGLCVDNGILIGFYSNGILCWNVQSGNLIMEELCSDSFYWPSGKHIITIGHDNGVNVKSALSYLITNYDFSET